MLRFLYHVGQAVAKQGLGDIAKAIADPMLASAANLIGRIGADVWKGLRDDGKQDKLHADIVAAAKLSFAEAARQATAIALQVAPNDPVLRGHVERFVTLVPAAVQASLKRADDPTGTTLPFDYRIDDESDIVKLLPVRFPREHFQPGYAPPFLRGWELVEQIGAGGFGEVWKVCNSETPNLIGAVKISHELNDAELSLLNEGDVLNRLLAHGQHPGIVAIQDNSLRRPKGSSPGDHLPWIRYEYVPGGDLTALILRWAALPMEQRLPKVLAAFRELCATVGHFHRLTPSPIVHRDLKPSNILITADGKLKIGDFGIGSVSAKRVLDGERLGTLSRTNTVQAYLRGAHTPLYAPPEQKSDPKHRPQPTDDVHALGVILYQMLTGRLDAAPGARFDRDLVRVPTPVIDLIGDCVDGEKSRRPTDGAAVLQELAGPTQPSPVTTPAAVPLPPLVDISAEEVRHRAKCEANLARWRLTEQPALWVRSRLPGWDHAAWRGLLADLQRNGQFWPMDEVALGAHLEAIRDRLLTEKAEAQRTPTPVRTREEVWLAALHGPNLERWELSGQPDRWVRDRLDGWDHVDFGRLLADLTQDGQFWPMDQAAVRARLEAIRERLLADQGIDEAELRAARVELRKREQEQNEREWREEQARWQQLEEERKAERQEEERREEERRAAGREQWRGAEVLETDRRRSRLYRTLAGLVVILSTCGVLWLLLLSNKK